MQYSETAHGNVTWNPVVHDMPMYVTVQASLHELRI